MKAETGMADFTEVLADRLRDLRTERGLSWDTLAEALKERYGIQIHRDSLKFYEAKGNHSKAGKNKAMRAEYLFCIADFYQVSCDYLLGRTDDPKPKVSVIDDLGLPNTVCDMLLENNRADSLQRKGLEALCQTDAFFDLCEKTGLLLEAMEPYPPEACPKAIQNRPHGTEKWEAARLKVLSAEIADKYPDLQKRGKFCCGREYRNVLKYQIVRLLEKALRAIEKSA